MNTTQAFIEQDHQHLWHPFTPMKQWRTQSPLIIEQAQGHELIDTQNKRYIDGVSSLWCNVHGHRVKKIDQAIANQLEKIAHSTLLGLSHPTAITFATQLIQCVNQQAQTGLNKVFYTDAGATAVEVAFKMAVGHWYHRGQPKKNRFIGLAGAYHGDTAGSMSVGFSELFHKPFVSMVFDVQNFPAPDALRPPAGMKPHHSLAHDIWPSEDQAMQQALMTHCLEKLEAMLKEQADQTAAICLEPVMQGAAGMVCQPPGFVREVGKLARQYDVLLILDEVATGFGRTGSLFAFEQELGDGFAGPDILCLAKGITGGYLPLAATICTDDIEQSFCGELHEKKNAVPRPHLYG